MFCPVCDDVRMKEVEKDNVLIDICPNCKGVWLDRGELEKITQGLREERKYYSQSYNASENHYQEKHNESNKEYHKSYDKQYYPPKHKKKKSMMDVLGDLFD